MSSGEEASLRVFLIISVIPVMAHARNEATNGHKCEEEEGERENGLSSHKYIPVSHVYHIKQQE